MSFTKGKGNIYSKFEFLIDKNLDNEGTAINNFNFALKTGVNLQYLNSQTVYQKMISYFE